MGAAKVECVYVSQAGLESLRQSYTAVAALLEEKTAEMGRVGREDTDLPENTYFKELRVDVQFKYPTKMRAIKAKIDRACLIEESSSYRELPTDQVWLGCKVVVWDEGACEEEEWLILGELEGNVDQKIISYLSPFGMALLYKRQGEFFTFRGRSLRIRSAIKALG
jgi:transcription elongation GreA/GreB family factor